MAESDGNLERNFEFFKPPLIILVGGRPNGGSVPARPARLFPGAEPWLYVAALPDLSRVIAAATGRIDPGRHFRTDQARRAPMTGLPEIGYSW